MVSAIRLNIAGEVFAKKLLDDIYVCCDQNINLISFDDYYALRLFVRELSVNRVENNQDKVFRYFVDSRSFDGNEMLERMGNQALLEQLVEYRERKKNKSLKTLDSFIKALRGY